MKQVQCEDMIDNSLEIIFIDHPHLKPNEMHLNHQKWNRKVRSKLSTKIPELGVQYEYINATNKVYAHNTNKTWLYEQPQTTPL